MCAQIIPFWPASQAPMASERPYHWKQGGECLKLTSCFHMNAHRCMHTCKHKHVHKTRQIKELLRMRKTVCLVTVLSVKQMLHSYLLELVWLALGDCICCHNFVLVMMLGIPGRNCKAPYKSALSWAGPSSLSAFPAWRTARHELYRGVACDLDLALPRFWIRGKFLTSLGLAAIISIFPLLSHCWSICQLCPAFYI